jgi:hypothetical protein
MKNAFLFILIATSNLILCKISCNNEQKQSTVITQIEDTLPPVENKVMIPVSSCYSTTTGKDSVFLKVEVFPNVVTGKLSYKIYQKDSNEGEFEGQLHGDTLLADYKFMSEGKESVRQVIFLIQNSMAIEGYGNMEEKNGKMLFKDTKGITFGKGLILKKVPCGEN